MSHNLKIVVFGRGTGESILVELENNEWLVVDCFRDPRTKKPAAITYLEENGLDPKQVLKKIVITHFHQDHIAGMLDLIKRASDDASVYMSEAMTTDEAQKYYGQLQLVNGYDDISGVGELCDIIEYMAGQNRLITRLKQDMMIHNGKDYSIYSISPSEYDCQASQQKFISLLSESETPIPLRASKSSPNHFCIALHIVSKHDEKSILLGADLEICTNPQGGWESAINSISSPKKDSIKVFKIPHHGSETGYHKPTWDNYVEKDAIAILTTFDKCDLPRSQYIEIFKGYTENLLSTTNPKQNINQVLSRQAEKILKSQTPNVRIRNISPANKFGYIETIKNNLDFNYDMFHDALKL